MLGIFVCQTKAVLAIVLSFYEEQTQVVLFQKKKKPFLLRFHRPIQLDCIILKFYI